jgi:hypothetical protein
LTIRSNMIGSQNSASLTASTGGSSEAVRIVGDPCQRGLRGVEPTREHERERHSCHQRSARGAHTRPSERSRLRPLVA